MKNILTIFIITIFLFLSLRSHPQSNLKVEHISLENGIANNLVFCILQDSKGFLWFGTMFGLIRYDGIKFEMYRYDPKDSNSLSNDDIISIYEDKEGCLWFGTFNGGVNKYDRSTGKFTRYLHNSENPNSISSSTVWAILQDKRGVMWFGTEGGGLCKLENGLFNSYLKDSLKTGSISGNSIRSIYEDKNGNLWIGTAAAGLNKFDRERENFTIYKHEDNNEKSLGSNSVASILEDSKGQLWIGTAGGGLNMFNELTNEFIKFKSSTLKENSISSDFVLSIKENDSGDLLIGTQNGLNKFDKTKNKFERILIYPGRKNSQETIVTFLNDRSGLLWVSTYMDGLHKIYPHGDKFKSFLQGNDVRCVHKDKSGRLWFGTFRNGLIMSPDNGKTFASIEVENRNVDRLNRTVNSIVEDSKENLWIGMNDGLYKLEKNSQRFRRYDTELINKSLPNRTNISKVYIDRMGTLWTGTYNGLFKIVLDSSKIYHYQNSQNDPESLSENTILSIYEDKTGSLWIGTYKGLNELDTETGKFKQYSQDPANSKTISNNYVFSFCEDRHNNFWIGTGGGLNIFDRKTKTFLHFNEQEGLPNSVITGIVEDDEAFLWLSTMRGISKLDTKNKSFTNYDTDDGLQSNMFNTGSYFKTEKGEIIFGGINGSTSFDTDMIRESKFIPSIVISSITKHNNVNSVEQDISGMTEIYLSYHENIIDLNFASLDFTNPKKNKYAYMLEGFDKDWVYPGNSNNVAYTNLDAGGYVFKVKGTNSDGVWNEKEAFIKINISPPFWKTWWFYGILIIGLIGVMALIQNYRIRRRVKNLLEIEKVKEKEREIMREQASRDYHDELGHKLTRISLYSRRINKKLRPTANGLTNDLNNIIETSNSLQSGAKDLIWAMNPREDTLYDFAVRLRDFGNELFENTGISFYTDGINEELRDIVLSMNSKRHLIYIFKEGMNNILKYADCSDVSLKFILSDGEDLEILLEDNGKGFDVNNCSKGYGLKNIFSRAVQINGKINVSSKKNVGTKIQLESNISNLISHN